ncbi:hypothetical protein A3A03_02865 [Candidatus Nomurabacteria bacterium RIFCSPLOWO2_01_FULL_40_18]|uniref:UDP-glucose/GDP-mannose dehydrogenase dimerisation domain-containing protein n=1 Tax=Candidatus Nomurabacteria bacterium RIFCSPLOWO2_01_FULL_40_18 TaxID=1801773 RepID=A0A1F6XK28_9BACT|nr:MAG: hypothetical protein A3A03_02865 [Candidatus Nomurabacteria bacterium RIFCSPLOWO2_01_FULL_40_18]
MNQKKLKDIKVGVVGVGMVGGSMANYFTKTGRTPFLYDPHKKLGSKKEVNKADVVFVCVPTPFLKDGSGFDLSYVKEACEFLEKGKIVVIKSTVIPGTTEKLQREYPHLKFLFNPEFLTEITADQDMNYPDRQIIGYTKESYNVAGHVMRLLPLAPYERIIPATEAEMVKYYGNTWFSVKVTFANQMYDLCEKLGIDYGLVKEAAAADKRIGPSHLEIWHKEYRGYGGKCLPKDTRALIELAQSIGVDMKLHKMAEEINNRMMDEQGIEDPEKFSKREG